MKILPVSIIGIILTQLLWSMPSGVGLENTLDISASGARAQRIRAEVIAENIANIDTARTSDGLPYRRKVVITRPNEDFSRQGRTNRMMLRGVQVVSVEHEPNAERNFRRTYNPSHPDADSAGFVYLPNIDLSKELIELTQATGAFENNVVVFNNTKAMMQASLELAQ